MFYTELKTSPRCVKFHLTSFVLYSGKLRPWKIRRLGHDHSESRDDMNSQLRPLAMKQDKMGFVSWLFTGTYHVYDVEVYSLYSHFF